MTSRPRLVCHIIHRLAVGGLENGLVNLINNLPSDYRHAIVCMTEATDFRARIRRSDVEICEIHKKPGKDVAAYGRVWKALRQLQPSIVHTRNFNSLDLLLPAKFSGVSRFVHSEHGLDVMELDGTNNRYNHLRRLSRLVVDRYIAVSRDLHDWLTGSIAIPTGRVETIYNGVDTTLFSPKGVAAQLPVGFDDERKFVVGTFGRFSVVKNQIALIEASGVIVGRRPELRDILRLVIIGDGELRGEIELALDRAGIRDLAWLPGFRNDTAALYRSLDLFVLPSLREGISNTVLEAMASGLPVIATRVGGNPEILPENTAGCLVTPQPEDLADAILAYVDNRQLAVEHGRNAQNHAVENFSLDKMVANYDRVYSSLL